MRYTSSPVWTVAFTLEHDVFVVANGDLLEVDERVVRHQGCKSNALSADSGLKLAAAARMVMVCPATLEVRVAGS